jgi:O-antigen ligase
MRNAKLSAFASTDLLYWIVYLLLGSTTLVVTINSFDSGLAKAPLLVLFASLLIVAFVAQGIWRGKTELRQSPADIPVLLFLLLIAASVSYSRYQWNSVQALATWVPFIISFLAGTQLFAKHEHVSKLIWALAIIASIVCVVGLVQFFFSDSLFLDFFMGEDRRITSTLTNATYLSGYIVLLFPTLLAFTLAESRSMWKRWYFSLLLAGLGFMLIVTSTRSSVAALMVSLIVFGLMSRHMHRKTIAWTIGTLLVVTAVVFLSPRLVKRVEASFENDSTSSFARRVYFWKGGYGAFMAAPFFGHGIGTYGEVIQEYRSPEYWVVKSEDVVPHAHNEVIETAVDLGATGVIGYLMIVGTVFVTSLKAGPNQHRRDRIIRAGIFCSLLAILIDNLANISLRVAPVGATTWLLLGVLATGPNAIVRIIEFRMQRWFVLLPLGGWALFVIWFGGQQLNVYKADGHVIKGFVAGFSKHLTEGINEYLKAVMLDPHNLLARSNLTLTLLEAGRFEEALQEAEQLQVLSPRYPKASLMQAAALVSLKRYTEALRPIAKELILRNHPDAYFYQASAYMGLSDTTREIAALEHLLLASIKGRIEYQLAIVSRRLIQITKKEEDIKRFKEIFTQLHSLFPSNSIVTSTIAELDLILMRLTRLPEPLLQGPRATSQK